MRAFSVFNPFYSSLYPASVDSFILCIFISIAYLLFLFVTFVFIRSIIISPLQTVTMASKYCQILCLMQQKVGERLVVVQRSSPSYEKRHAGVGSDQVMNDAR